MLNWSRELDAAAGQLVPFYAETLDAAAQQALTQLPSGTDWGGANAAVLRLAEEEAGRAAQQTTQTSQAKVSRVVADWIGSGGTMDDLIDQVATVWPGSRADVAAVTEVTRLYARGNHAGWVSSGVVTGWKWKTASDGNVCPLCLERADKEYPIENTEDLPPAHAGDRCWVVPVVKKAEEL